MARLIEHNGERLNMAQWARKLGLSRERVRQRLVKYEPPMALQPGAQVEKPRVDPPVMVTIRMTPEQRDRLHSAAHRLETSVNRFCMAVLTEAANEALATLPLTSQ